MKEFLTIRPLSVIAAFFYCGLGNALTLGTLFRFHSLGVFDATEGVNLTPILLFYLMSLAFFTATIIAFYRDSESGYRVFTYGSLGLGVGAMFVGVFPSECAINVALVCWLAYDLRGFNIVSWVEARLNDRRTARAHVHPAEAIPGDARP